jgi:spore maturation protein CgeB
LWLEDLNTNMECTKYEEVDLRGGSQPSAKSRGHFRILCMGETWLGSDARAAFSALRRLGNDVEVVDPNNYIPEWRGTVTRALRKFVRPLFVKELSRAIIESIGRLKPDCLFVFKGNDVDPSVLKFCREAGVRSVVYYPDVSFMSHGQYIPRALPLYDRIFNTKSYGIDDMQRELRVTDVQFLAPGFDPELHCPVPLSDQARAVYGCDVSFIGTWSAKKESLLLSLRQALPEIKLKIWGFQWQENCSAELRDSVAGFGIVGDDYTKAICASSICLGLLSERGIGSSSGDLITARTFQIPACGAFMLHERNNEVLSYFAEGRDAEFFGSTQELAQKVSYYLAHEEERKRIAEHGRKRSLDDDYSIDGRMKTIVDWLAEQCVA